MLSESDIEGLKNIYGSELLVGNTYINNCNRYITFIKIDGKWTSKQTSKLKLESFLQRRLSKDETVDHIDSDYTNDDISNLQLLSRKDNISKAWKDGVYKNNTEKFVEYLKSPEAKKCGDKNGKAVFSNEDVKYYRECFESGKLTKDQIINLSNASRRTVENMLNYKSYVNI